MEHVVRTSRLLLVMGVLAAAFGMFGWWKSGAILPAPLALIIMGVILVVAAPLTVRRERRAQRPPVPPRKK